MTAAASAPISNREFLTALLVAVVSLAVSAALLIGGYLLVFPQLYPGYLPDDPEVRPFTLGGRDLSPVMAGTAQREGDSALVMALTPGAPDDQAILRRTVNLDASDFSFLRYHLEGRHPGLRIMLFWKTASGGDEPFYAEIDNAGDGAQYHNLRRSEDWQGTITEIALGVFGDLRGETLRVRELRLEPYSSGGLLGTVWDEWTAFAPWDQATVHAYRGVPESSLAYPAPSIAAITGFAMMIFMLAHTIIYTRKTHNGSNLRRQRAVGFASLAVIGWIALDGLWQAHVARQSIETIYLFAGKSHQEKLLSDWDAIYYEFAETIKAKHLPKEHQRIPVLAAARVPKAFGLRLEYHLLPQHDARVLEFSYPPRGSDLLQPANLKSIQRAATSKYFILLTSRVDNASKLDFRSLTGHELPKQFTRIFANEAAALYSNIETTVNDRRSRP